MHVEIQTVPTTEKLIPRNQKNRKTSKPDTKNLSFNFSNGTAYINDKKITLAEISNNPGAILNKLAITADNKHIEIHIDN